MEKFSTSKDGYNKEEVNKFVNDVVTEVESMLNKIANLEFHLNQPPKFYIFIISKYTYLVKNHEPFLYIKFLYLITPYLFTFAFLSSKKVFNFFMYPV